MKQQLKFLILTGLSLAFSACDSLHHSEKVRRQQSESERSFQTINEDWQLQRLQISSSTLAPSHLEWENDFLLHSLNIEPLIVNYQWQGTAPECEESEVQKAPEDLEGPIKVTWS